MLIELEGGKLRAMFYTYHGLGGLDSSFHVSGIINRRVTEAPPPDADGVIELKKTSMRTLSTELILDGWVKQ